MYIDMTLFLEDSLEHSINIITTKGRAALYAPLITTLRPRQNGRYFPDDVFKRIFLNENIWNSLRILLKLVPKVPVNTVPALVEIMAWCRSGDKLLSEPMIVNLLTHICVTRPQWVIKTTELSQPFVMQILVLKRQHANDFKLLYAYE